MPHPLPVQLRARVMAERLMADECTIVRTTGSTTDPDTGVVTPTNTTVYSGKCKVQQRSAQGSPRDLGEAAIVVSSLQLHIPASATGVEPGDRITITASVDPDLVGRAFTVKGLPLKTFSSARRLDIEAISS